MENKIKTVRKADMFHWLVNYLRTYVCFCIALTEIWKVERVVDQWATTYFINEPFWGGGAWVEVGFLNFSGVLLFEILC